MLGVFHVAGLQETADEDAADERAVDQGVSLRFLKAFAELHASGTEQVITTRELVDNVVKGQLTAKSRSRLVDLVDDSCFQEVGRAHYFVSHCWSR